MPFASVVAPTPSSLLFYAQTLGEQDECPLSEVAHIFRLASLARRKV
jgi:hypothetical protein